MKAAIIMPAYNEERRIGRTLEDYGKFFSDLKKSKILDSEIIVIINKTTDRTEKIVKNYSKKYKIIKYLNFKRGGKGFAIVEGFKEALKNKFDLIGFVDADMSTSPKAFYDLINNIGNYDSIIASRYVKGAIVRPRPTIQRKIVSRIFNFLINLILFLNYEDTQCGAKLFKKKALEKTIPFFRMSQWAFDVDLLYNLKKNKFKIREFPTVWSDTEYSKINFWRAGPLMFLAIIRLRILNSRFRNMVNVYDKFGKLFSRIINK